MNVTENKPWKAPIGKQIGYSFGGLFLIAASVAMVWVFFWFEPYWKDPVHWQHAPCKIEESHVILAPMGYDWLVKYSYQFGGREYASSKYHFFESVSQADKLAQKYQPGTKACCYVEPGNPANAVLLKGTSSLPFFFFLLPLGCTLVGIFTIREAWFGQLASPSRIKKTNIRSINIGLIVIFSFFIIAGLIWAQNSIFKPPIAYLGSWAWKKTPCVVQRSQVQEQFSRDGEEYRVDILYSYSWNGRDYRSNTYNFDAYAAKEKSAKQAVLKHYPKGSIHACYVNPLFPHQSVLKRTAGDSLLLLFVPFLAICLGAYGLWLVFFNRRKIRLDPGWAFGEMRETPEPEQKTQVFKPRFTDRIVIIAKFALILAGMGFIALGMFRALTGREDWPKFFLLLAAFAMGMTFVIAYVRGILQWFSPYAIVTLHSSCLRLGDEVPLVWEILGNVERVTGFSITLIGLETYHQNTGQGSKKHRHIFFQEQIVGKTEADVSSRGETRLKIPEQSMHSLEINVKGGLQFPVKYSISWLLIVYCENKGRSNVQMEYPLTIQPLHS